MADQLAQPTNNGYYTPEPYQAPEPTGSPIPEPQPFEPIEPVEPIEEEPSAPPRNWKKFLIPIVLIAVGLLVIVIVIILLSQQTPQEQPQEEQVTLQMWGVFVDEDVMQPLLDEYKTLHPNVTIEYANRWADAPTADAADRYRTELNRVLNEGDPVAIPDIFMVNNTWTGDYEEFVKPNTTMDVDTFRETYYPVASDDFISDEIIYGSPLWMDVFGIVYNRDILLTDSAQTSPPSDWPTFKSLAQRLTTRTGNQVTRSGFAAGVSSNMSFSAELINLLLFQNGVTMLDEDGQVVLANDSDSFTAINFFKDFANPTDGTWSSQIKNDSAAFLEGKTAMVFIPSYRYRDILRFKELYEITFDVDAAPVPQLTGPDVQNVNFADYWGSMVSLRRPNTDASWEFLTWLGQPDQLRKLSGNIKDKSGYFGILYPRQDMNEDLENDPYLKAFNASLLNAKSWYMVRGLDVKEELRNLASGTGSLNLSSLERTQEAIQEIIDDKGNLPQ